MELGPRAVEAWQALPGHVATMNTIAAVRIAMSDVCDVAPPADAVEHGERLYGAAFSPHAPRWDGGRWEDDVDKWLRLSAGAEPLTLLDVAATRKAALAGRVERPYVEPNYSNASATITDPRRTFVAR